MENAKLAYCKTITPNRSLSSRGALALMAGAILFTGSISVMALTIGAWPILPFLFAMFAAVCMMLNMLTRHGDDGELLLIDDNNFYIVRRCGGDCRHACFPRYWARIYMEPNHARLHAPRLYVRSHGRALEIGSDLDEAGRRHLATELRQALRYDAHPASGR